VLQDVQKDTSEKEVPVIDVKDTALNVNLKLIVTTVMSQDTYGEITVSDHAQEDTCQKTVIVSSDQTQLENFTEESSKTLTEMLSSELDSIQSMIYTSVMP